MNITYQNAFNATSSSSQGSYDRARGGKIEIKLTIPSQSYDLQGPCRGNVKSPELKITFEIDIEKLPLVNVSSYTVEAEQIADATLDYPGDAIVIKEDKTFG